VNRRYLCVRCWREQPLEMLYYVCPECQQSERKLPTWVRSLEPGTGRPVSSLRRPWWRRPFVEPLDLACPRHPAAELRLFCPPPCGAPITRAAELDRRGTLAVGFAGPTSAGKTLFTLAAVRRLRGSRVGGQKVSLLGLGDTEERFGTLESALFADCARPKPTSESASGVDGTMNFAWEVTVSEDGTSHRRRDALIAISDLAGETWGTPSHEPDELLDRYLDHVGGVVFLVDGASMADDLGLKSSDAWDSEPRAGDSGIQDRQWLRWLVDRLGKRVQRVDLALTVSKGDLLWADQEWSGLETLANEGVVSSAEGEAADTDSLRRALDASGRGDLAAIAETQFRRTDLFIASSLGFRPGEEDIDEAERLRRPPEPRHVEAPVLWLLAQRVRGLT